jgi:hypothetical protein
MRFCTNWTGIAALAKQIPLQIQCLDMHYTVLERYCLRCQAYVLMPHRRAKAA